MTYRTEFPDFPEADLPKIPEGFADTSWHNNSAPSFESAELRLSIWIDYADPDLSEWPEERKAGAMKRFSINLLDAEGAPLTDEPTLETDTWDEVLAAIIGEQFAAGCREAFEPAEFAEIRRRNALPAYAADCCATHDFADANDIMAEAFEAAVGRPLALGDDEPNQQADFKLWGAAWEWAKKHHLTAAEGEPTPLEKLTAEYVAWCDRLGLPQLSADEQDEEAVPEAERPWLADFITRWDAAEDAAQKR